MNQPYRRRYPGVTPTPAPAERPPASPWADAIGSELRAMEPPAPSRRSTEQSAVDVMAAWREITRADLED